jgi:hypothetical protein
MGGFFPRGGRPPPPPTRPRTHRRFADPLSDQEAWLIQWKVRARRLTECSRGLVTVQAAHSCVRRSRMDPVFGDFRWSEPLDEPVRALGAFVWVLPAA